MLYNIYYSIFFRSEEKQPTRQLGMSNMHRRWASLSLNQEVSVVPYDPSFESQYHYLKDIELEVGFLAKYQDSNEQFDTVEMSDIFCQVLLLRLHFKDTIFINLTNA